MNAERNPPAAWGVRPEQRLADMQGKTSNQTGNHDTNINDCRVFPDCLTTGAAQLVSRPSVPDNCGGHSPRRVHDSQHYKAVMYISGTNYSIVQNQTRKNDDCCALVMVCAPVAGLRGSSSCRSPWPPRRLSPVGPLLRTCSRCHSLPVGSSSLPSRKTNAPRDCGSDLKTKIIAQGEFNPSLPRPWTLCVPPPWLSNPASYRRNILCRSFNCGSDRYSGA